MNLDALHDSDDNEQFRTHERNLRRNGLQNNLGVTTGTISSLISLQVFCVLNISGPFLLVRHQVLDSRLIHTYEVPGLCPIQRPPVFDIFFIFPCPCKKIPGHYLQTDLHHFLSYHYTLTIHRPTSISYAATLPQQTQT
jgi:hypothetical protein